MRAIGIAAALALTALIFATGAMSSTAQTSSTVTARGSAYGRILFDGRGFALYSFTRDHRTSSCAGACAQRWPPYIVTRRPRAASGVTTSRLGTIRRGDGKLQVTYASKPLYFYIGDRKPLQVLCQNVNEFGGLWRAVRPNGSNVR